MLRVGGAGDMVTSHELGTRKNNADMRREKEERKWKENGGWVWWGASTGSSRVEWVVLIENEATWMSKSQKVDGWRGLLHTYQKVNGLLFKLLHYIINLYLLLILILLILIQFPLSDTQIKSMPSQIHKSRSIITSTSITK